MITIAIASLVGWTVRIPAFAALLPGAPPMYPLTAIGLLACSIAWILIRNTPDKVCLTLAGVLGFFVLVLGIAALCESLFNVRVGIDQALFLQIWRHQADPNAGRIAPNTAFDFVLLGFAFLLLIKREEKIAQIAQVLVVAAGIVALFGALGYAYFEPHLYRISHFTAMSFSTSIAFLLLCTALLASPIAPRQGSGIWLGVVVLTAVVSINAVTSFLATENLIEKNNLVDHTQVVTAELDATLSALLSAEASERGYLYTGQQQYLEPLRLGKPELAGHIDRLASLIADNPVQQQNVVRLRSAVQDALSFFEQAIALEAVGEHQSAKQLVLTGAGKTKMDAVHAVLDAMNAEEAQLLATRSTEAKHSERYLLLTIPISHFFMALLVILAGFLVRRDLRKRVEITRRFRGLAERKHIALLELRKAQEALVRAEKLSAVGRMASSVAHEINNPLEAVTNLIWIAKSDPTINEELRKHLVRADEELRRVAHITRQTLGFYRDSSQKENVKVREVLESVLGLYASRMNGKHISVRTRYEDCYVFGYTGELRQLFSNLCANAIDAVPAHGVLAVKASRSRDWGGTDEPGVRVTIADNGCGIDAEHLGSLFEPFFTTKEATGTGLGLWVTKQIAEKHGGRIAVRSSAGLQRHYTVFSLFLPVSEGDNAAKIEEGSFANSQTIHSSDNR
jgi:signal transduction histidine kinase